MSVLILFCNTLMKAKNPFVDLNDIDLNIDTEKESAHPIEEEIKELEFSNKDNMMK
jgi:hypothetical protein